MLILGNVLQGQLEKVQILWFFVHNHPSGNPKPSSNDKIITERLVKAGEILNISVLDHIIIGNNEYFSFRKENII